MTLEPRAARRWMCGTAIVAIAGLAASAQTALRVKGTASGGDGVGLAASIELEAFYGYRGLDFVGQKTFKTLSSDTGQWSVLGVTSGAWMFAAHAPGRLPQVLFLPVQFTQKNPASATGGQLPWDVAFELMPAPAGSPLERAAAAARGGERERAVAELAAAAESDDPQVLIAAGEIALYARSAGLARALFERAVAKAPALGRAHLGLASAAMMSGDWDTASKRFWEARERGLPERLKRAVGMAITELQRITRSDGALR